MSCRGTYGTTWLQSAPLELRSWPSVLGFRVELRAAYWLCEETFLSKTPAKKISPKVAATKSTKAAAKSASTKPSAKAAAKKAVKLPEIKAAADGKSKLNESVSRPITQSRAAKSSSSSQAALPPAKASSEKTKSSVSDNESTSISPVTSTSQPKSKETARQHGSATQEASGVAVALAPTPRARASAKSAAPVPEPAPLPLPTSRFADRFAPPRPPTRQMNNLGLDTPKQIQAIDPKLANAWKTKEGKDLTEAEVLAMPESQYMNDKQLEFFRVRLQKLKDDLLSNAGETTEHLREETSIVPDPADRATIEEEHALELRTRDRERKLLKKISQSLSRIEAGDYGFCDETGEPIGLGRLIARPTATLSLEAQQRRELKQKMFGD